MSVRLLIADDHPLILAGLRTMLQGTEFEVVAEATSGEQVLRAISISPPDCILLDIRMKRGDGISTLSHLRIQQAEIPIVMISAHSNPTYIAKCVALGANGFYCKSGVRNELLATLRTCADGGTSWTRKELRRVSGGLAAPKVAVGIDYALTHREMEVLGKLADGLSNNGIAESLEISRETVKEHVQNVLRKLGLSDRTQAAVWAVRSGLA